VLDPACGSGAFPMGMLNEMIKKIDPPKEKRYKTKLHIIKNCIYGVDINPIAVQITKLRFFISLLCEQTPLSDKNKNFGIKVLPNLETKFVCADSLKDLSFAIPNIQKLRKKKEELWHLRENIVKAETFNDKMELRERDENLCKEIMSLLAEDNIIESIIESYEKEIKELKPRSELPECWVEKENDQRTLFSDDNPKSIFQIDTNKETREDAKKKISELNKKIANIKNAPTASNDIKKMLSWNPYDQNQKSEFFNPEWMFGIKNGFDIVIGNPPYGAELKEEETTYLEEKLKLKLKTKNSAIYFIFVVDNFLKKNGINSFIVPKSLSYSQGWNVCADFLLPHLIGFYDAGKAFRKVLLEMVVFIKKKDEIQLKYKTGFFGKGYFRDLGELEKEIYSKYHILLTAQSISEIQLLKKILDTSMNICTNVWGDYLRIERGLNWQSIANKNKGKTPIYRGKQLKEYYLDIPTDFIDLNKFDKNKYAYQFQPKILNQLAIAHVENPYPHFYLKAHLDIENNLVYETISCSFMKNDKIDLRFLLAINNSKMFAWLLYKFVYNNAIRSTRYDEQYIAKVPCPNFLSINQNPIITLVDQIIANPQANTVKLLKEQIDKLVYKLYDLTEKEVEVIEGRK